MDAKLKQLADDLRVRYGKQLQQVIFFGSHARGDASLESDYDCLLIFDRVTSHLKADLDRLAAQWLLEQGIVLACVPLSKADLERLRYEPFLQNAYREGIAA